MVIIGNSKKFIDYFSSEKPIIISWRDLKNNSEIFDGHVFCLVGFDFNFKKNIKDFYIANVREPYRFLKKQNPSKIIYISTDLSNKNITFSWYLFCKQRLAFLLSKKFKNIEIYSPPTIVNNKKPDLYSSSFIKMIFYILIRLNLVKCTTIENIFTDYQIRVNKNIFLDKKFRINRNLFIDKLLRITLG